MPAIIDHQQRREQLAEVAAGLIADGGTDAATVRAVAEAAGFSTKVVSHYFENKRSLLLSTYRFAASRSRAATHSARNGNAIAFVEALLPTNATQRQNWLVWYAFWSYAIVDEEFAAEQKAQVNATRSQIQDRLAGDRRFAEAGSGVTRRAAQAVLTEIIGVSLQAIFDTTFWTPARQKKAVKSRLLSFLD